MFNRPAFAGRPLSRTIGAGLCLLAGLLFAVETVDTAEAAKPDFAAAVKAQNAHHLKAVRQLAKSKKPPTVSRDYEDKITRREWTLKEGALSVSVTLKKGGPPDGLLFLKPAVAISVNGKQVIAADGAESFPDNPVFVVQIAEMDPSNPHPEVLMSVYTGGAHCCSDTRLFTSARDGKTWREVEAGLFDGGPLEARDLDGDGRYELAMRDNAFLYTFGCYACSTAPLHVLQLKDGQLINASANPAFRPQQVDSLVRIVEWASDDADRNGFLAGYVGQKILLGESEQAWTLMLDYHDRTSDWGLDWCRVKRDDKGECPAGKMEMLTYPQALERFLKEAGYDLKK